MTFDIKEDERKHRDSRRELLNRHNVVLFEETPEAAREPFPVDKLYDCIRAQRLANVDFEAFPIRVNPSMAKILLRSNRKNRQKNIGNMLKLAKIMKAGGWRLNGEAIVISANGNIIQGQHRLEAVIHSGVAIDIFVILGVPDEYFPTYDRGRSRTVGDIFSIQDEKNCNALAAAAKLWLVYKHYGFPYQERANVLQLSDQEMTDAKDNEPLIREATDFLTSKKYIRSSIAQSYAAIAYIDFHKVNRQLAQDFFEALETGANLAPDSPILQLRHWLDNHRGYTTRPDTLHKLKHVYKAFKLYVEGRKTKKLVLSALEDETIFEQMRLSQ